MLFPFPISDLAEWLAQSGYQRAAGIPAFASAKVYPWQNVLFERRHRTGQPLSLGVHSHPGKFLSHLPQPALDLYRKFYLHQPLTGLQHWPELAPDDWARWQITPVATPAGALFIVSSIPTRSPGEFVYLGDDSGLLIEAAWALRPPQGPPAPNVLGGSAAPQGPPALRALDICCGCGVVGLGLPPCYGEIVGLDANPLAIELAHLNHQLNSPQRQAHWQVSDLLQQAQGRFDLIIGNPPALPIRPDLLYAYGGPDPAELTLRILDSLPDLLNPFGRCLLLSFSVRDQLWQKIQGRLHPEISLSYRPRRHIQLSDPQLGWMEHCWLSLVRDSQGQRRRLPMNWSDWASQQACPWLKPQPPLQLCYAGHQRPSRN